MTPIRNLTGNLEEKYLQLNSDVRQFHDILKGRMSNYIAVDPDLNQFYGPSVLFDMNKQIVVAESYLNYIWSSIFFIFVFHEEASMELLKNPSSSFIDMTSTPLRMEGLKLLAYSKAIIKKRAYNPWPKNTISPLFQGTPTNDIEEFALKVNGLYSTGMAALFFHELGHIYLDHSEEARLQKELKEKLEKELRKNPNFELAPEEVVPIIAAETEADNFAFDLLFRINDNDDIQLNNAIAVLSVHLATLLSRSSLKGLKQIFHPNLHERVFRIIQRIDNLNIKESGYFSHLAIHILVFILTNAGIALDSYDAGSDPYGYLLNLMNKIDDLI